MACKSICKMCSRLILSQAVSFANGTLTVNLPAGSYENKEKYCIVIAQSIPDTTTINAPVMITIGDGETAYPLTKRNCAQVTACGIRTRTKYATCVVTSATGGTFRMLGSPCCAPDNTLAAINGGTATAEGGGAA